MSDSKGAAIVEMLEDFLRNYSFSDETPLIKGDVEKLRQAILAILAQEVKRVIGEPSDYDIPEDMAGFSDHSAGYNQACDDIINEQRAKARKAGLV